LKKRILSGADVLFAARKNQAFSITKLPNYSITKSGNALVPGYRHRRFKRRA
jgi:hypothetical protein